GGAASSAPAGAEGCAKARSEGVPADRRRGTPARPSDCAFPSTGEFCDEAVKQARRARVGAGSAVSNRSNPLSQAQRLDVARAVVAMRQDGKPVEADVPELAPLVAELVSAPLTL